MRTEAIKTELIEWLTNLNDDETILYLKLLKDSEISNSDWWYDLSQEQKSGLQRGLSDVDAGRVTLHEDVKFKYGL